MKTIILILSIFVSISAFADKPIQNCEFDFKKEKLCGTMTWVKQPVVVAAPTAKDAGYFRSEEHTSELQSH